MNSPDPEPDPPDPSKEPSARTKRREANKKYDEYVIKTGLDKLCLLQGSQKHAFMTEISKRVESVSKGVHRLSICMNLHVRDALKTQLAQNNYDYSKVNIDMHVSNDTFARQFMANSGNLDTRIIDISNRYSNVIPAVPRRCLLDMNTITFACSLFNTNWKNHIEFNFSHYQKKYVIPFSENRILDILFSLLFISLGVLAIVYINKIQIYRKVVFLLTVIWSWIYLNQLILGLSQTPNVKHILIIPIIVQLIYMMKVSVFLYETD